MSKLTIKEILETQRQSDSALMSHLEALLDMDNVTPEQAVDSTLACIYSILDDESLEGQKCAWPYTNCHAQVLSARTQMTKNDPNASWNLPK